MGASSTAKLSAVDSADLHQHRAVSIAARRSQMCSVTYIDTTMCAKATFTFAGYSLGKRQQLSEVSARAAA